MVNERIHSIQNDYKRIDKERDLNGDDMEKRRKIDEGLFNFSKD